MADRKDFYFRHKVDEADLDGAFDALESADWRIMSDLGYFGVFKGLDVGAHVPVPGLQVDVEPGVAYDQAGRRISVQGRVSVDISVDHGGTLTEAPTSTTSKLVGIYAKFERAMSDRRIDGNSQLVYFSRNESYRLLVAQSGTYDTSAVQPDDWAFWNGKLPTSPAEDCVLLAVVWRRFGQVAVTADDIGYIGRQSVVLDGTRRAASTIDVSASSNAWADGSGYTLQSLQQRLDSIQTDLGSPAGAAKIGAAGVSDGGPSVLDPASVQGQTRALLGFVNARVRKSGDTMTGSLLPGVTGLDLGSAAARWDAFVEDGVVYGSLLPGSNGVDFGSTTARWDAFIQNGTVYGSFLPNGSGINLGAANARWNGFFSSISSSGSIIPSTTNLSLGASGARWGAFLESADVNNGSFGGTLAFGGSVTFSTAPVLDAGFTTGGHVKAKTSNVHDIGESAKPFRKVYAQEFAYGAALGKGFLVPLETAFPFNAGGGAASWSYGLESALSATERVWMGFTAGDYLVFPLSYLLPTGATSITVEVVVRPASASRVTSERLLCEVIRRTHGVGATLPVTSVISTARDNGTTNVQMLSLNFTSVTLDRESNDLALRITTGTIGGVRPDAVVSVRVYFLDPGPRNW